jgi:hypothetical protein
MRKINFAQMESALKSENPKIRSGVHKTSLKVVDPNSPQLRESRSLLGDTLQPDSPSTLKDLSNICPSFKSYLDSLLESPATREDWFLNTTFFTQINRPELAHEMARLHPEYAQDYDSSPGGRQATEKTILDIKKTRERGDDHGYVGLPRNRWNPDLCPDCAPFQKSSPREHFLERKSIKSFVKRCHVNPKRRIFSSEDAAKHVTTKIDLKYVDEDQRFYTFRSPVWEPVSDAQVNSFVKDILSAGCNFF